MVATSITQPRTGASGLGFGHTSDNKKSCRLRPPTATSDPTGQEQGEGQN
jgi:hypothetical protein